MQKCSQNIHTIYTFLRWMKPIGFSHMAWKHTTIDVIYTKKITTLVNRAVVNESKVGVYVIERQCLDVRAW